MGQYDLDAAYPCPQSAGWLLYSQQHTLITTEDVAFLQRVLSCLSFRAYPQGHFYPLEDPHGFAALVADLTSDKSDTRESGQAINLRHCR